MRQDNVERAIFFGCPDIQVTRHRQLLAFTVFSHFREEAGKLDVISGDRVRGEDFMDLDISQVFPVGFVFEFEVFCGNVSDFVAVGGGIYF